mgnify:CR=1 FL=1
MKVTQTTQLMVSDQWTMDNLFYSLVVGLTMHILDLLLAAFNQKYEEDKKQALQRRDEVPALPIEDTIWLIEEMMMCQGKRRD